MSFLIAGPALPAGPGDLAPASPERTGWEETTEARQDGLRLNEAYLKEYLVDTGKILTSPRHWEIRQWRTAALVLSVSAGLYVYDQDLNEWFQKRRGATTNQLAEVFTPFGNPLYILPAAGFVYYYGENRESETAKRIGLLGAESIVLASAFTGVMKFAGHRHRPVSGDRYDRWDGPGYSTGNLSFPSEHTSAAFSLATVVASEVENTYAAPVAYGIASLVALSRVNDNEHWSSDVFLGAALGYFTGRAVLRYHAKEDGQLALLPQITGERYGIIVSYSF